MLLRSLGRFLLYTTCRGPVVPFPRHTIVVGLWLSADRGLLRGRLLGSLRAVIVWAAFVLLILGPWLVVIGGHIAWLPIPLPVLVRGPLLVMGVVALVLWLRRRRRLSPLGLAILVALALAWTGLAIWPIATTRRAPAATYQAADRIIQGVLDAPIRPLPAQPRDLYVIILDTLANPQILRTHFGLDVTADLARLEALGFTIPPTNRSHYPHTYLSLASTLNLRYLDPLLATTDAQLRDVYPLRYLMRENALLQLATRAGYTSVLIGSDYASTTAIRADICRCRLSRPHYIEHAVLSWFPGLSGPATRWAHASLRASVRRQVADLAAPVPSPALVVAHLPIPHPPFVFAADGRDRSPRGGTPFFALSTAERYRAGYRAQARYALSSAVETVAHLLARRPRPAIVLAGDHGPIRPGTTSANDADERLGAFLAYRLPGVEHGIELSLVNTIRQAASTYLGVSLAPLPARHWTGVFDWPYDLTPVP